MAKLSTQTGMGTSYHRVSIRTTVNELIELIGEPQHSDNTGREKVNFMWECETSNEKVFTIYDWKQYQSLDLDEEFDFHIGAKDKITSIEAKYELLSLF